MPPALNKLDQRPLYIGFDLLASHNVLLDILDFGSAFKKHVFSDLYNHNITYMQSPTNMKVPQSSTRVRNVKYFPSLEREMLPVGLSRSNWGNINNKKGVLVVAKLCSLHVVLSILS